MFINLIYYYFSTSGCELQLPCPGQNDYNCPTTVDTLRVSFTRVVVVFVVVCVHVCVRCVCLCVCVWERGIEMTCVCVCLSVYVSVCLFVSPSRPIAVQTPSLASALSSYCFLGFVLLFFFILVLLSASLIPPQIHWNMTDQYLSAFDTGVKFRIPSTDFEMPLNIIMHKVLFHMYT